MPLVIGHGLEFFTAFETAVLHLQLDRLCDGACRIDGENETTQSHIDPLDFATVEHFPLYAQASPIAFVLEPGEAVIIPQVRPDHPRKVVLDLECLEGHGFQI